MIINSLSARNLLKYGELDVTDLPKRGLIAVCGPNESGKSSIGETLSFALFGRTFALGFEDRRRLIKWGTSRASAVVEFTAADGHSYRLERYVDDEGTHGARLDRSGESAENIAQGPERVDVLVPELIGFDFESFVESFYLAQREITSPHAHSHAVKIIAGLAPYEQAADEIRQTVTDARGELEGTQAKEAELQQAIHALGVSESRLEALNGCREALDAEHGAGHQALSQISAAANNYGENFIARRAARSSRASASFWSVVLLIFSALSWGGWWLLERMPEDPRTQELIARLNAFVPTWEQWREPWLLVACVAFSVLLVLSLARRVGAGMRADAAQQALGGDVEKLEPLFTNRDAACAALRQRALELDVGEEVEVADNEDASGRTASEEASSNGDDASSQSPSLSLDSQRLEGLQVPPSVIEAEVEHYRQRAAQWDEQLVELRGSLDQAILEEEEGLAEANRLTEMAAGFRAKGDEHSHRIVVGETALELLNGAARHVSNRFNTNVRGSTGRILPLFTEGRYEHVKIDQDLVVQLFSRDKGDFMDLDETSSGTQRQIMLALRLALAEELVRQGEKRPQFVFLDEPFAFFDRSRTESSLEAMPQLSDDIAQIWVTSQEFPDTSRFDRWIHCDKDADKLASHPG